MYKVVKRDCPMFGIGPYVCEFVCDTASDVSTLPTSTSEGTGGKTAYDNQMCASGSIAIVAENGSESKQYMLNNQDIWCPYSIAVGSNGGSSSESSVTIDFALSETSENPVANKVIVAALDDKANVSDIPNIKVNAAVDADTVNGHSVNADVPENAKFTDTIPDLSPYAKKTDIPTELPANGGNADEATNAILLNGKPYSNYVNYLGILQVDDLSAVSEDVYGYLNDSTRTLCYEVSISPLVSEFVGLPHNMWWHIKYYAYGYGNGFSCQTAFPVGFGGVPYIRYSQEGVWSDWKEFYTSGNKPYVTGEITFANPHGEGYTNSPVPTNHGFMPSKILYWSISTDCPEESHQVYSAGTFDETSFTPARVLITADSSTSHSFKYQYIIFK